MRNNGDANEYAYQLSDVAEVVVYSEKARIKNPGPFLFMP
jgi:hypothetical protein